MLNDGREVDRGSSTMFCSCELWRSVNTASPCCVGGEGRGGELAQVFSTHFISIVLVVLDTDTVADTWLTGSFFLCIVFIWIVKEDLLAVAYSHSLHLWGLDPEWTLLW